MQTARRLYIYLLSGISLGVLVTGLSLLLTVLFDRLGLGQSGDPIFGNDEAIRQQLTIASALITVSLPVWLIHWYLAERGVRPGRVGASVESNSVIRGLYFAIALGALLLATATAGSNLVGTAVLALTGGDSTLRNAAADLALLLAAGAAWAYHVALRSRDWAREPLVGAAAFLPRTYLYVATFVGLLVLLFGVNGIIELIGRLVIDEPPAFSGDAFGPWWGLPFATASAQVLVGGGIWLGHAQYAERLRTDPGRRGASERPARLRLAFFVAAIGSSLIAVAYYLAEGARNLLAAMLGVSDASATPQVAAAVILPAFSAVPFGIAWWFHQRQLRAEAATFDSNERIEAADRLGLYAGALIGLAYGASGIAWLIGLVIQVVLADASVLADSQVWPRELAQFAPLATIGIAVWLWSWTRISARFTANPLAEAASTARRVTLLIVLAAAVLAGIASLGVVLYRLFGTIFGIAASGNVVLELSTPIGILIVAVVLAIYHGLALRRDQALRGTPLAPTAAEMEADAVGVTLLRLLGPRGGDTTAALIAMRQHLPAGFALEEAPSDG
jgi:Domain of unknown function (DUF5671)